MQLTQSKHKFCVNNYRQAWAELCQAQVKLITSPSQTCKTIQASRQPSTASPISRHSTIVNMWKIIPAALMLFSVPSFVSLFPALRSSIRTGKLKIKLNSVHLKLELGQNIITLLEQGFHYNLVF